MRPILCSFAPATALSALLLTGSSPAQDPTGEETPPAETTEPQKEPVNIESLEQALAVIGLEMDDDERAQMVRGVRLNLRRFEALRRQSIPNDLPPAFGFHPIAPSAAEPLPVEPLPVPEIERPDNLEELAFASLSELRVLLDQKKVTSVELTRLALSRLERLDPQLECVVTLLSERALARAAELDEMLADGKHLGPLHGIPYGAKDLLAVAGAPTTWGAKPYENQVIDTDAAVVKRLDEAGAVLVAKLSLGALAMGDVWFGGRTNNPWKPTQGSSGSSAGSASATASGCVPFAIGSETLGSIISPSARCGVTGLRPTFGTVDIEGAMALSWTMDKLGPMCRSVEDASIVYEVLRNDAAQQICRFQASTGDVRGMRVGYLEGSFADDSAFLAELRELGCELVPFELPKYPVGAMTFVLGAEAAAAFDELTRSNRDDELTRQDRSAWPNRFRIDRLIPAVEYIQAMRMRTGLMQAMEKSFDDANVDVYVHPTSGTPSLSTTNLTGQPSLVAPRGFRQDGTPRSISFTARNYREDVLLRLARAWQEKTGHHRERRPVVR